MGPARARPSDRKFNPFRGESVGSTGSWPSEAYSEQSGENRQQMAKPKALKFSSGFEDHLFRSHGATVFFPIVCCWRAIHS